MRVLLGVISPLVVYGLVTFLHVVIPARRTTGYVASEVTGAAMNYRINGRYVLLATVVIWYLLGYSSLVPYTWLYEIRWWGLVGAAAAGLAYSLYIVLKHSSTGRSVFADLWFGRVKNPQFRDGFIDAKMWLYLVGVVMLQLNVLSFAAYHVANVADVNDGYLLGCAMVTWFCLDYIAFEKVHLWTYDFIAERVGFKLGFGCLTFYPYFYAVSLWFTADLPNPHRSAWLTFCFGVLFLGGWVLTRGANLQKYVFKVSPGTRFLWMKPEVIADETHTLLVSGFWGASRHINYLGEVVQAVAVALASGYFGIWMVWLYPAYYVALLLTRQADDDKVCRVKYGALWDQYTTRVRYKIVPYVY